MRGSSGTRSGLWRNWRVHVKPKIMFKRLFYISKWQHYRRLGRIRRWMHFFCSTKFVRRRRQRPWIMLLKADIVELYWLGPRKKINNVKCNNSWFVVVSLRRRDWSAVRLNRYSRQFQVRPHLCPDNKTRSHYPQFQTCLSLFSSLFGLSVFDLTVYDFQNRRLPQSTCTSRCGPWPAETLPPSRSPSSPPSRS